MFRLFLPTALSASVLASGTSFAAEAAEASADEKARAHFDAGVAHLEGKDPERFHQAYREFRAAYAASSSWKVLGNLGIASLKLERYGEAIDALSKYLELGRGELTLREAVQVKRDLERLRAEQATVSLEAGPEPYWIVDTRIVENGEAVVNQYGPFDTTAELRVRAGQHEFHLERAGQKVPPAWSVALRAGDAVTHKFVVQQLQEEPEGPVDHAEAEVSDTRAGNDQTVSYLLWGGAAATAIASTAFYFYGDSVQADSDRAFARACPRGVEGGSGVCGLSTTSEDARAANWKTAALVTAAGAVGLAAAGTIVYWLRADTGEGATMEAGVSPTGVLLRGFF